MNSQDGEMHFLYEVLDKLKLLPFDIDEDAAFQVAFHMSDWMSDLVKMTEVMSGNNDSEEKCYKDILGFCLHLPEHVAKAKQMFELLKTDNQDQSS